MLLFYGIPIPDLQEMVQRRILAEIDTRRRDPTDVAKRTEDELKDNISLGLWDDLHYLTLEDLEFISQVSTESVKFWLVVNQVQRAFRRDAGWEWITIQAYSTFGEPGKNHVYDARKWSLNFSDSIRDHRYTDLSISKAQDLAKSCGFDGETPEWLVCTSKSKTEFFELLTPSFFKKETESAPNS